MASMSKDNNVKFLHAVLTANGEPSVNWPPVCAELGLEKGTATKRWSRIKIAMRDGKAAAATSETVMLLMLKYSARDKIDWERVAKVCKSTAGAVSKRYSRLGLASERDVEAGESSGSNAIQTKGKGKDAASKLKRGLDEMDEDADEDEDEEMEEKPARKRTRMVEGKVKTEIGVSARGRELADRIKPEPIDEDDMVVGTTEVFDEVGGDMFGHDAFDDEICKSPFPRGIRC